jgi:hypothetical protein
MKLNPYKHGMPSKTVDRKTGEEFNPFNFGTPGRSGTRKTSATERLFDNKGELNANSDLEALQQIKGIIDGMHDGTYDVSRQANYGENLTQEEGDSILREAFADPTSEGFSQVGQALLNPIKEIIDYEGLARKFLAVRTVKQGEVVRYDKDVFVVAHIIAEDGQTPQSVVEGRYVYPPEFEVSAYVSIELKDTYRAQFDVLNRSQDKARQSIEYQEDVNFVTLATAAGTVQNTQSFFAVLNLAAFEAMRYQIERHRLICDKFLIHRQEVSDLVNTVSAQVDPVTQRELIMAGYIGNILNASIVTTAGVNTYEVLQPGVVQAFAAPDYLGGMPIRVELISEPTNEFHEGRPRKGWYWWEMISQVIINPAGVALGQKT